MVNWHKSEIICHKTLVLDERRLQHCIQIFKNQSNYKNKTISFPFTSISISSETQSLTLILHVAILKDYWRLCSVWRRFIVNVVQNYLYNFNICIGFSLKMLKHYQLELRMYFFVFIISSATLRRLLKGAHCFKRCCMHVHINLQLF